MTRSHGDVPSVLRGRIYGADIEDRGEKYQLAVSNNRRNARLGTFPAVRLFSGMSGRQFVAKNVAKDRHAQTQS